MPAKKSKTKRGRSQDKKLVAAKQKHEVRAVAKKKKVSAKAVRSAVKKVGHSRKKVEQELTKTFPESDYNTLNVY